MYPRAVKRQVLRSYAMGASLRDLAAEHRVSLSTLWRWASDAGLIRNRGTAIRMYHEKRPVSELGVFHGLPRGPRREGTGSPPGAHPFTREYRWPSDSPEIREFVDLAWKDGWLPNSIVTGRSTLRRYEKFVRRRFRIGLDRASSHEFVAYRTYLVRSGKQRSTQSCTLGVIAAFYRLRAEHSQSQEDFDQHRRIRNFARVSKVMGDHRTPLAPETLDRILSEGYRHWRSGTLDDPMKEDFPFLMTLLYTGGRAQFYGLQVKELDFERMVIRTTVKGGRHLVVPLHPTLSQVLREHLVTRPYTSEFLFRHGRDPSRYPGVNVNRHYAWLTCKRAQEAAHVDEPVYPQRFRVTLASLGRRLSVDPEVIQAILGHRHLGTTLDIYSRVQSDEAREAFAKIHLTRNLGKLASKPPVNSTEALLRLIPRDRMEAVNVVLKGLIDLMRGTSPRPQTARPGAHRLRQLQLPGSD